MLWHYYDHEALNSDQHHTGTSEGHEVKLFMLACCIPFGALYRLTGFTVLYLLVYNFFIIEIAYHTSWTDAPSNPRSSAIAYHNTLSGLGHWPDPTQCNCLTGGHHKL